MTKTVINLDASGWTKVLDFYEALLKGIGAPPWHGRNLNALIDSMVRGGINKLEPPYTIEIRNTDQSSSEVSAEIMLTKQVIADGRAEALKQTGRDVEVEILVC